MSFTNRWMIVGRLTTQTALHIGNGAITQRAGLVNEKKNELVEINAVGTDCAGQPYIPGSALKGNLRAMARRLGLTSTEQLFGTENPEKKDNEGNPIAVGGKAEFFDARIVAAANVSLPNEPPHWQAARLTGVAAGVTLDRVTKTASEQRLFHQEFVPPGVSFEINISGQNFLEEEILDLLSLLEHYNRKNLQLGAGTGSGNGAMRWALTDLRRLASADVVAWLADTQRKTGYAALQSLTEAERANWLTRAHARTTAPVDSQIRIQARLDFQSNFLVNDPSKTGKVKDDQDKAGHTPLRNSDGKPVLPATSVRGAFRAQAEKIVRTMGGASCACYLYDIGERHACQLAEDQGAWADKLAPLCPICLLFGATGWKALLDFSDFTAANAVQESELFQQEFVAIDRFTGGGAESKKFNARSVLKPVLQGDISLDLQRLQHVAANGWPLGLLALVLRDLREGDVRFGYGAAKGYGAARLAIESMQLPAFSPALFNGGLTETQWQALAANPALDEPVRQLLQQWVNDLQTRIQAERTKQ